MECGCSALVPVASPQRSAASPSTGKRQKPREKPKASEATKTEQVNKDQSRKQRREADAVEEEKKQERRRAGEQDSDEVPLIYTDSIALRVRSSKLIKESEMAAAGGLQASPSHWFPSAQEQKKEHPGAPGREGRKRQPEVSDGRGGTQDSRGKKHKAEGAAPALRDEEPLLAEEGGVSGRRIGREGARDSTMMDPIPRQ